MCVCTVSIDSAGNLAGKRLSSTEKPVLSGTKQKKNALAAGHSPNTAKAMGRAAAQEVARQIDAGLLKEETAEDVD